MLKLYTLVGLFMLSFSASAQVDIILVTNPGTSYNGDTIQVVTNDPSYTLKMKCVNISGAPFEMLFRRVIMSNSATFEDQFCDNQLCYPLATAGNDWTTPSGATIADTDTSDMKPLYDFTASGEFEIRYYVIDGGTDDVIDSVDVHFTSGLGVEDLSYEISAYPNPANDVFNIKAVTNGNNLQVTMYNVLGEQILTENLVDGLNTLSIDHLTNGVYFYTIMKNNKAIETKKLIVRK